MVVPLTIFTCSWSQLLIFGGRGDGDSDSIRLFEESELVVGVPVDSAIAPSIFVISVANLPIWVSIALAISD